MSSLGEIFVMIKAVNEATPEFEAISSDAARLASDVSGTSMALHVENLASPEINRVAEDAARVKAEVEDTPITITFEPVEVPPLPPLDTTPIQSSLNEVSISATEMGTNVEAAGSSFTDMETHARACEVSLRTVAGGIRTTAMMGTELTVLAADFGLVDKETSKYLRTIMMVIMLVSTCARMYNFLTIMTTGQTAAVAVEGTTETATTGAVTASGIAHSIKTTITWAATAAQNALNISHATFLALTGVGIGIVIAAAAAMAIFASQMNVATSSVKEYNATAAETPERTRGITRAGEQAMYRRGVE
jgi:hypothetical protein